MMNKEILEYQEMANEMRNTLEAEYQMRMFSGDKIGAHDIVKTMMEYGVISKDDPRVDPKTRIFSGAGGIDVKKPEAWGQFDYRRKESAGFIPRYLYGNIKAYEVFEVPTMSHWGKRVEGNYQGDIKISDNKMKFKLYQDNYFVAARRHLEEIKNYLESKNIKFNGYENVLDMVNAGVVRILHVEALGNVLSKYRTFGWAIVRMDDSGVVQVKTILKYEAMYNSWININDFTARLCALISKFISGNVNVVLSISPDKALQIQKDMMSNDKIKDKQHDELVAKLEKEASAKAASKGKKAKASKE